MANDKLMNHTQGEDIISNLDTIAQSLENLSAISPAKFGMGYAVTNTPADTAAKTANIANFTLTEGAPVNVKFTYANTATNATLNLNNTGAKPILYKGDPITTDIISAGDICTFIYSSANGGSYNIINIDALSGAGAGTVKSVGASTGLKTDQTGGAAINMTGSVKLDLKSETPFEGSASAPVEIEDKIYPVALDADGHPAVSVPGTEYTQGAGINISEDNEITNTGVFDVTTPTSADITATDGDIKVTKKVVNSGVVSDSVTFVKPKGINDPAFKALDSSTSGLTADDDHVPTSKTVQDAIDTALASASVYKGTIAAFNDLPTSTATVIVRKGWYYRVSTAWSAATGTPATDVGDIIIAEIDSPSKSIDGTNWSLLHNEANTDANVAQSPVSTNAEYEVLFSGSADNTAHTEGTGKDSGLTYNPSTNKLTVSGEVSASSYSGLPEGNTTTKGIVQLGTDADKAASGSHGHGNITNGGALQTTDVSIASGDKLVITDASDSNKVARSSVSFDGSTATQALTKKGTFENFQAPITNSNKLSSDLVDDTNKTHRFATADQLTQIATNKTNISYAIETGVKNWFVVPDGTYSSNSASNSSVCLVENGVVKIITCTTSETRTMTLGTITIPAGTYVYTNCFFGSSSAAQLGDVRLLNPDGSRLSPDGGGVFTVSEETIATVRVYTWSTSALNQSVTPFLCVKSIFDQDSNYAKPALPNTDLTRMVSDLQKKAVKVYTYHVNPNESDPEDAVTYLDDATGLTPAKMGASSFSYGSWANAWFLPRPCVLKFDGTVDYYLNPNDYSKKTDGTASTIDSSNSTGNVMLEFPKIWVKRVNDGNGARTVSIAPVNVDGTYKCWSNINAEDKEIDHFYLPAYNGTIHSSKMRSLSGVTLNSTYAPNYTRTQEVTAATANNPSGKNMWYTETWADMCLVYDLLYLMGKSLDVQRTFGQGLSSGSETAMRAYVTGTHNAKGLFYGDISGTSTAVKVLGMENLWGCRWHGVAGLINDNGTLKVKMTYGVADGSTTVGYNTTGSGYLNYGSTYGTNGFVKKMQADNVMGYKIIETAGTDATYYCDYYYTNNSQSNYALLGGTSGNASRCGFGVYLADGAAATGWVIGGALSCKP